MDFQYLWEVSPELLQGLIVTIEATLFGTALAIGLGLVVAIVRLLNLALISGALGVYVMFVRNTPLLVQLYFLFYVLPEYGITLSGFTAGMVGLGLHFSTYTAEVFRAGFDSVPKGQWEAARALSFNTLQALILVVLPQALRPVVPPLGNFLISIFKDSSLLATITVYELLGTALSLGSLSFQYTTLFTAVGVTYLLLSYPSSLLVRALESRMGRL